jgi:hypothetical protein
MWRSPLARSRYQDQMHLNFSVVRHLLRVALLQEYHFTIRFDPSAVGL